MDMKKSASLALLLAAAGCSQLWADDAVLTADAFVSTDAPSSNFGALPTLRVGGGNTAFMKFDLSTLPPGATSASIASAQLIVFVNRVGVAGHPHLHNGFVQWAGTRVTPPSSGIKPPAFSTLSAACGAE